MIDSSPAPQSHVIDNIEGAQSTSPAQGVGLFHQSLDPANFVCRKGRVEDIYMDKFCAVVSLYGYRKAVPCQWGSSAFNRWTGVRAIDPPSVGTEVLVLLSNDHKYGWVIATLSPTADSNGIPSPALFNTSVSRGSDLEAHKSKDFGFASFLINAANGTPADVLPGDSVKFNGQGIMMAMLELTGSVSAGAACGTEVHTLDQLLRHTGWNLQERTSMGERQVMEDHGYITEEESGTHLLNETMGNDPEGTLDGSIISSARRFLNLRGHLGGLLQRWILRPSSLPSDMTKAKDQPDLGLMHHSESLSGMFLTRSVVGGGIMKTPVIAVPKKSAQPDDPSGSKGAIDLPKAVPFKFSGIPESPASHTCQLRDFVVWLTNRQLSRRLREREKDWEIPDETDCPTVFENMQAPKIGEFFREFPAEKDVMQATTGDQVKDDSEVMKAAPGFAWVMALPSGGISIRDIWGSQITTDGGHIDISASKDIRITAGRNLVMLGGDDVVIKGRNSVDITSSLKQVRIKAQGELFIHAEEGGMLMSLGSTGRAFKAGPGEEMALPGICIKVPNKGGVIIDAGQMTMNLSNALFINGDADGSRPQFAGVFSDIMWETTDGGFAMKNPNGYFSISEGNTFMSGSVVAEGNCYVKGDGVFGSQPSYPGEWTGPTLEDSLAPSFEKISKMQYPYSLEQLKQNVFGFRTDKQYSADRGVWFEHFWQREMEETVPWVESPAADGSYPYPGKENYTRNHVWWSYKEENIDTATGRSVKRDSLSEEPAGFTPNDWNSFPVHPS